MMLFKQYARREATSVISWAMILGLMGFFVTYLWHVMSTSGSLDQLQSMLQNAQGVVRGLVSGDAPLTTLDGWISGYALGSWIALPFVIFTALFVAGIIMREMDRRTLEFVLALPVSRTQVIVSRWLVFASSLAVVHFALFLGVVAGVSAVAQTASPERYAVALVNSFFLYLFIGSLLLLVSLFIDDYGPGTGALLGVGLGLFFVYVALDAAAGALEKVRELLPFSQYDVQSIVIKGTVPWGDMAVLAVGAAVLLALSVWVFNRKQITV